MNRQRSTIPNLQIPLGHNTITVGASWLVVIPAGVWVVGTVFVPVFGAFLTPVETWSIALAIAFLSVVSLIAHTWAHIRAARLTQSDTPGHIPLYPLGDAAQVWPAAATVRGEALVALAGPATNLLVALVAYLVWNVQLNPYLNIVSLFLVFFNGGLAAINLAPLFPLDGGRLVRVIGWSLLAQPAWATRLARRMGLLCAAVLAAWGVFLIAQQARFSWPNGVGTLLFAGLILLPLLVHPGWRWNRPEPAKPAGWSLSVVVRGLIAGLLFVGLLGITTSLVPTNQGLEAPGIATDVAPMVEVPAEYWHPSAGQFLLTTVFSQAPIAAGEWLVGQLSPVVELVPPERIVPADETVQEVALRNFRMLDDSQLTAIAVGLRLAGYDATINGLGASVLAILPDSLAQNILQPGDVIIGLNGEPVETAAAVSTQLKLQAAQNSVQLQLQRDGAPLTVTVPLLAPAEPDQPPRIGILLEDAGFETNLPFPVGINPQKIIGGPSAGLMFTLSVYNMVTPQDLTGGRIIAGTGTINPDGTVGPIGGVKQKVVGAEFAGAEYFLSPPENYDDARAVARRIRVVEVTSAAEAIQFLRSLPPAD